MQKEHFEILMENIDSKFELVLEGHAALEDKMDTGFAELHHKVDLNSFKIEALSQKIDAVDKRLSGQIDGVDNRLEGIGQRLETLSDDLRAHRADTEAHHGVYRIKES